MAARGAGTCTCNICNSDEHVFLDAEVKLLVAEKQQWLLHQRMSGAKDTQISKLCS